MRLTVFIILLSALAACKADETVSGFADPAVQYRLMELDGMPFEARATVAFPQPSDIIGQGPCNSYFATQSAPYPWFDVQGIGASRMACPDLNVEQIFFAALQDMTLVEVQGETLILTNDAGREMVFAAD